MKRTVFAYPYLVWMLIFILAPMLLIVYYAFTSGGAFTLANVVSAFTSDTYMPVLLRSVIIALLATAICLLLGYPIAYMLSKMKKSTAGLLSVLFIVPMWMNFLLRTYAWQVMLDNSGIINTMLSGLYSAARGLVALFGRLIEGWGWQSAATEVSAMATAMEFKPLQLLYTEGAVMLGTVYNFLPFMILPIYTVLSKLDNSYIEAANDLGAGRFRTFFSVVLPLSMPGVISGITMVFIPAITTFAISRLLGGGMFMLYGDLIENQFITINDWGSGSALSFILLVLVIISMIIMRRAEHQTGDEGGKLW